MKILNKFKKWLSFNPPVSSTMEGWRDFNAEFKTKAPIRYALEKASIHLSVWKKRYTTDVYYWIRHRTVDKYHVLQTGLKPGYYDKDHLMLYVNFNLLKDYVEVECAHIQYWSEREWKSYSFLEWIKSKFTKIDGNKYGIKYLEYESSLGQESPAQAANAKEILILYKWWTEVRPNRETKMPENIRKILDGTKSVYDIFGLSDRNPECKSYWDGKFQTEQQWDQEDEYMLIRLMKVRKSLWI